MNEVIKRGPGRPPKAKTAQERIDEIRLLEFKGNGFIVPRPAELTMETFRAWMRQTAELGSADHVGLVWQYGNQSLAWRDKLIREYHDLCRSAGKRWGELLDAAEAEKHKANAEHQQRTRAANHQRAIAQAEAKLAQLKAAQ